MYFQEFVEGQSYMKDVARFRPLIRIQTFIDQRKELKGELPADIDQVRKAVVRDWWRLVLWFIRLRKAASRDYVPISLIEVEERIQRQKFFHGVQRVKQAKLEENSPHYGTDGEDSSDIENPVE